VACTHDTYFQILTRLSLPPEARRNCGADAVYTTDHETALTPGVCAANVSALHVSTIVQPIDIDKQRVFARVFGRALSRACIAAPPSAERIEIEPSDEPHASTGPNSCGAHATEFTTTHTYIAISHSLTHALTRGALHTQRIARTNPKASGL